MCAHMYVGLCSCMSTHMYPEGSGIAVPRPPTSPPGGFMISRLRGAHKRHESCWGLPSHYRGGAGRGTEIGDPGLGTGSRQEGQAQEELSSEAGLPGVGLEG